MENTFSEIKTVIQVFLVKKDQREKELWAWGLEVHNDRGEGE
jgi:hypothetical protein